MKVLDVRNVDEAYIRGLDLVRTHGVPEDSRNGRVLVMPCPVSTVYHRPTERVLFDATRDANPFFHLIEAVWMLAGLRDARILDDYVKNFSSRYAEEDGQQHGAYGFRWSHHFGFDQLYIVGSMLREDPRTRRAVLTMWDPRKDLGAHEKRDLPCNTHVYFHATYDKIDKQWDLNITVCCRSNDIVWGAYGANAVHMSIMGEVVAGLAGMRLGRYTQMSNNYHMYDDTAAHADGYISPYALGSVAAYPIFRVYSRDELISSAHELLAQVPRLFTNDRETISHPWLIDVVNPVMRAHAFYREEDYHSARQELEYRLQATDWKLACLRWLERRIKVQTDREAL